MTQAKDMASLSTSAIILRRIEYGDFDLILSLLTLDKGKISVIAKSARKSSKRFGGILELFAVLKIVCASGRRGGLPVLQEATLLRPFPTIRANIRHTAYASYWAELVDTWSEEGYSQPELYRLLEYALTELDRGQKSAEVMSVMFQVRFLMLSGHRPNLRSCQSCRREIDRIDARVFFFEAARGGLVCGRCRAATAEGLPLSRGTLKQLQWLESGGLSKAGRVRFSKTAVKESLAAMESFVPYQLGRNPRSLAFLRQIRGA